jgi:hypothetical protein
VHQGLQLVHLIVVRRVMVELFFRVVEHVRALFYVTRGISICQKFCCIVVGLFIELFFNGVRIGQSDAITFE